MTVAVTFAAAVSSFAVDGEVAAAVAELNVAAVVGTIQEDLSNRQNGMSMIHMHQFSRSVV